ncbi:hypothetical protein [Fretibacter rubidus]|uniref:hypothetical protein n=1 Tax=Fretibacter rubidus TaxID=570162 RepID=UPI00352A0EA8
MKLVRNALLLLCFFPSITFGVLAAEIFPWAILFFIASIHLIQPRLLVSSGMLILPLLISAAVATTNFSGADSLRSVAAYLNVVAAFIVFLSLRQDAVEASCRLVKNVLIFLIVMGVLQFLNLLGFLEGVLSFIVPRASVTSLSEMGNRGVTLLSSEPSRAGVEIVYLYVLCRLVFIKEKFGIFLDILCIVFLLTIIKAVQPLAFGIFAVSLFLIKKPSHAVAVVAILLIGLTLGVNVEEGRAVVLLETLASSGSFSDAIFFLANESGHRLLTTYAFTAYGFQNPFGAGVGMWPIASIEALRATGVDITQLRYFLIHGDGNYISVRGSGLLSNMMLDVGIVGTSAFIYWVFYATRNIRRKDKTTILVLTLLFVKIAFIGSVGEPLPWIITALALKWNYNLPRNQHIMSRSH